MTQEIAYTEVKDEGQKHESNEAGVDEIAFWFEILFQVKNKRVDDRDELRNRI